MGGGGRRHRAPTTTPGCHRGAAPPRPVTAAAHRPWQPRQGQPPGPGHPTRAMRPPARQDLPRCQPRCHDPVQPGGTDHQCRPRALSSRSVSSCPAGRAAGGGGARDHHQDGAAGTNQEEEEMPSLPDEQVERALAIVAHPDDTECWAGGTIAQWAQSGIKVTYCVLTDGEGGGFDPAIPRRDIPASRESHEDLVRIIGQARPQRILTWSPEWNWPRFRSCHPDHRRRRPDRDLPPTPAIRSRCSTSPATACPRGPCARRGCSTAPRARSTTTST